MMQGDSYGLKIEILNSEGGLVTPADVSDVEITVGFIRKTYAKKEVLYSDGLWIIPLRQDETFKLPAARIKAQVRVAWAGGSVEGVFLDDIRVHESLSKEVLA